MLSLGCSDPGGDGDAQQAGRRAPEGFGAAEAQLDPAS